MNIAVTGGYGTGKSSICSLLTCFLDSYFFSADQCCHKLLCVGAEGWMQLKDLWGDEFFDDAGEVKKPLVKETIFNDSNAKRELEDILHPLVRKEQARLLFDSKQEGRFLISEIPLLFENNLQGSFDISITVYVPDQIALLRGCARDSLSIDMANKIIASQLPIDEKVSRSDHMINNSGMLSVTYLQTLHLASLLKKG